MGKLVLYACGRLNYAWQELKFNWKAWRVYERSFKKLEVLDRCVLPRVLKCGARARVASLLTGDAHCDVVCMWMQGDADL